MNKCLFEKTSMEEQGNQHDPVHYFRDETSETTQLDGDDNQALDLDSAEDNDLSALHRMELVAHSVLNGPLDQLNETVELLGLSQLILLARLNLMQERMSRIHNSIEEGHFTQEKKNQQALSKIKDLRKRLQNSLKLLSKIEFRTRFMNEKLQTRHVM